VLAAASLTRFNTKTVVVHLLDKTS